MIIKNNLLSFFSCWLALAITLPSCHHKSSIDNIISGNAGSKLSIEDFGSFEQPWAMTFLTSNKLLVTEKSGKLFIVNTLKKSKTQVLGVPKIINKGQGGLGDIILHPNFTANNWIYLSYAKQDSKGNKGAVVIRATLNTTLTPPRLENTKIIWQQIPKLKGSGHYSYRLAFSPNNKLFITSGDRQEKKPAQNWSSNLGKIIRLNDDGSPPIDNPFQNNGELAKTFWTLGHRNMLGIAFDTNGKLWAHEMGPRHGDELNLIVAGDNYGWPIVSWGDKYSGLPIPDHDTRPEFHTPELYWVPTVAPSGMIIYSGTMFPQWQGDAFIGGLRSKSLIRININGNQATEAERFDMGERIREVEQGSQGAIWVLEDNNPGRLLKLTNK